MIPIRCSPTVAVLLAAWNASNAAPAQAQVIFAKAATVEESVMRGAADVIRSRAAANLSNSEAAINWEQARSLSYDNAIKFVNTYFERKRINKEYRDAARRPPPTTEQLAKWAKERTPKTLTSSELDPITGAIGWPTVLLEPDYEELRAQLEQLFAQKAQGGITGIRAVQAIRRAVDECEHLMRKNIDEYPGDFYMESLGFLASLKYEVMARRLKNDIP